MKIVLAVIAGVIAGLAIVFMGESTTGALCPVPDELHLDNRDDMRIFITSVPIYVLVMMVIFWLASSFLGGMLAARLNRADWKRTALVTGGILLASAILNLVHIPHPAWMWITAIAGYLPAAFLGGWIVRPKTVPLP